MKEKELHPTQQVGKSVPDNDSASTIGANRKRIRPHRLILLTLILVVVGCGYGWANATQDKTETTVYDYSLQDKQGNEVSLSAYKGKVLLIVNTATACGFTPQYEELEAMYRRLKDKGFEILDIPCNQFGNQAPGTDEEIAEFCRVNFGTEFPQFKKSEVNGENELPLYTWLKSQKGFEGFDKDNSLTPRLESRFDKVDPEWRSKSDIKWNFTKFLIDRNGNAIARFEPTKNMAQVEEFIKEALNVK